MNLQVSVPSNSMLNIVTVRCGHCTSLLSVNLRGLIQSLPVQNHSQVDMNSSINLCKICSACNLKRSTLITSKEAAKPFCHFKVVVMNANMPAKVQSIAIFRCLITPNLSTVLTASSFCIICYRKTG